MWHGNCFVFWGIPQPKGRIMKNTRRSFLAASSGIGLSAAAIAVPSVARANQTFSWKMTSAYPKGAPFYMDGPGSATDLAKRIAEMSDGRLKIQVFGAGELIPAF
jgi:TRAP-type mannitol/chloroaromatic compound transport system substrate-binding protein